MGFVTKDKEQESKEVCRIEQAVRSFAIVSEDKTTRPQEETEKERLSLFHQ